MAAEPMLKIIAAVILSVFDRKRIKMAMAERVERSVSNINATVWKKIKTRPALATK